jgi:hypothetical protein
MRPYASLDTWGNISRSNQYHRNAAARLASATMFDSAPWLVVLWRGPPVAQLFDLVEVIPLVYLITVVLDSLGSLVWTTRRSRRLLGAMLNRPLQSGEESSIVAWMRLSDEQIEAGGRQLAADPFGRAGRTLMAGFRRD